MPIEVICRQCGSISKRSPSKAKRYKDNMTFCNMKCYRLWEKSRKIPVKCINCGQEFMRYKHHADKNSLQFCSNECHGKWKEVHNRGENHPRWIMSLLMNCDQCGQEFRQKSKAKQARNKRNFCSSECARQWMIEHGVHAGQNNPAWKPRITKICHYCGRVMERKPSTIRKTTHLFCSAKCRSEWMSKTFVGENSFTWKGGHPDYYGPDWRQQRSLARQRDKSTCRHCGKTSKKIGKAIDVHHIIPFRTFGYVRGQNDYYKQANHLSNLICLCPSCHHKAEAQLIPIQPCLLP